MDNNNKTTDKATAFYEILKKDPKYDGIIPDERTFFDVLNDEAKAQKLHGLLVDDPMYKGVIPEFPQFYETIKKKESPGGAIFPEEEPQKEESPWQYHSLLPDGILDSEEDKKDVPGPYQSDRKPVEQPKSEDEDYRLTKLSKEEEKQFQKWWASDPDVQQWKEQLGNKDKSPDDPKDKYDYRGAWKAGLGPDPEKDYHWGSYGEDGKDLKAPDHPTRWKTEMTEDIIELERQLESLKKNPPTEKSKVREHFAKIQGLEKEVAEKKSIVAAKEFYESPEARNFEDTLEGMVDDKFTYFTNYEQKKQMRDALSKKYPGMDDRTLDYVLAEYERENKRPTFVERGKKAILRNPGESLDFQITRMANTEARKYFPKDDEETAELVKQIRSEYHKDNPDYDKLNELLDQYEAKGYDREGYMNWKSGYRNKKTTDPQEAQYNAEVNRIMGMLKEQPLRKLQELHHENYLMLKALQGGDPFFEPVSLQVGPWTAKWHREWTGLNAEYRKAKAMFEASSRMLYLNERPGEEPRTVWDKAKTVAKGFVSSTLGESTSDKLMGSDVPERNEAVLEMAMQSPDKISLSEDEKENLERTTWDNIRQSAGGVVGMAGTFAALNQLGGAAGVEKVFKYLKGGNKFMRTLNPVARAVYTDLQFQLIGSQPGAGATFHGVMSALDKVPVPGALKAIKSPILQGLGTLLKADVSLTSATNLSSILDVTAKSVLQDKDFQYELEKQFGSDREQVFDKLMAEVATNWIFGFSTLMANKQIAHKYRIENMKRLANILDKDGYPESASWIRKLSEQYQAGVLNQKRESRQELKRS